MVDPARTERTMFTLPWHPEPLGTDARIAYMKSRVEAEIERGNVSEAEIDRLAAEAAANLADLFAQEEPIAVDLKCAPDRIWIQSFEGSHPLGYGPLWTTVSIHRGIPAFSRVVFPSGFIPHRITESLVFGVVADAAGLQRLATVPSPPFARQPPPSPTTIPATSQAWPTNRGDLTSHEEQALLDSNRVSRQPRTPATRQRRSGGQDAGAPRGHILPLL